MVPGSYSGTKITDSEGLSGLKMAQPLGTSNFLPFGAVISLVLIGMLALWRVKLILEGSVS